VGSGRHGNYDERLMVKNASVPDDKTTPIYHNFEAPTAATNANTVDKRAAPKTILYSCCGPARLSTNRSALGGLSRESQSTILSSIPIVPSRWESWRPMSQIYAFLFTRGSPQFSVFRPRVREKPKPVASKSFHPAKIIVQGAIRVTTVADSDSVTNSTQARPI